MPSQHTAATPLHLSNELFGEPRLADAGLPQDDRCPPTSAHCSAEGFTQRGELLLSVDQWRLTGRAQEAAGRLMSLRLRPSARFVRRHNGSPARDNLPIDAPRLFGWIYPELAAQDAHACLVLTQRIP